MQTAPVESTATMPSDLEWARRIAADDREALRLLMRRHNQTLFRIARSIVRDDADAEDAVQEAWINAYGAIGRFRGEAKLSTWLTRIVMNEAIRRRRKSGRAAEVISIGHDADLEASADDGVANDATPERPERAAMRADTRRMLEAAIDALPETFRAVFVLRAIEEMPADEVAAILAIPEATVRTRFFRARGQLRESLAREIDFALEDAFSFAGARCDRIVTGVLARIGDWPGWRCLMSRTIHSQEN
ncbi:MAG: RNA polymerase sigma factor [Betaproteobacteria bacterium]